MPRAINDASLRHLRVLFGGGSGAGLTDGQLLQRFAARDGLRSERAFAVLVERHGPMVLRVARSVLRDHDLADDVFQNAFLALAKRARSLWVRDSIGPWLYAVTVRVATRMRAKQARRRRVDEKAASLAPASFEPGVPDDLGAALHEEIARLPDRQRQAVVLCLVEGLTHDQAARRLDWPVGTVRSRLARGRERLKGRLERRGLAPSSGLLIGPGLLGRSGIEAVRGSLVSATVQGAVSATQGGLIGLVGTVPAGAIAATITVMKESAMIHRVSAAFGLLAAGVLAVGVSIPAQSKPEPALVPSKASQATPKPEETLVRVYAVADLVARPQDKLLGLREGKLVVTVAEGHASMTPLIDFMTSTIAPGTWTFGPPVSDPGGDMQTVGSIVSAPATLGLVIRHTPEVHEEVVERLRQLRRIVGPLTGTSVEEERDIAPETTEAQILEERIVGPEPDDSEVVEERVIRPEPTEFEIIEERIIGPKPSDEEIIEERIIGPEASTTVQDVVEQRVSPDSAQPRGTSYILPDGRGGQYIIDRATETITRQFNASNKPSAQEERIDALERKLDAILDELRAIRGTDHRKGDDGKPSGLLP